MREHEECQRAIEDALAAGKPGRAEYLATRCDRTHGVIDEQDQEGD